MGKLCVHIVQYSCLLKQLYKQVSTLLIWLWALLWIHPSYLPCWLVTWDEFSYFWKIIWQRERLKDLIQALEYLNIYTLISMSESVCVFNLFLLNVSCSFRTNPWSSSSSSSSSSSRAVSVSWDSSLTDRQADGSDTSDISGIQQNNVDGNQWRQWQRGRERLEEKTGEESEWKGEQGNRERAVAY